MNGPPQVTRASLADPVWERSERWMTALGESSGEEVTAQVL
ncbi:MAG: hypothetical protein ACYDHU_08685 [Acidimicrobiales bacterium]